MLSRLKSNVGLEPVEVAELIFTDAISDYLPSVESSRKGLNCSPLICAVDCGNIRLTGKGNSPASAVV
jgi:polygalacturonase